MFGGWHSLCVEDLEVCKWIERFEKIVNTCIEGLLQDIAGRRRRDHADEAVVGLPAAAFHIMVR